VAVSTGLLVGYCGLAAATGLAVVAGGTRHPTVALGLLGLAVLVIAVRMSWPGALGVGVLGWLFYDGFFIGRHAQLAWHGAADLRSLGILLGAAAGGCALSFVRTIWLHRAWSRGRARVPARPAAARSTATGAVAPVINLADARLARRGLPVAARGRADVRNSPELLCA
jgi:hypothetical protein